MSQVAHKEAKILSRLVAAGFSQMPSGMLERQGCTLDFRVMQGNTRMVANLLTIHVEGHLRGKGVAGDSLRLFLEAARSEGLSAALIPAQIGEGMPTACLREWYQRYGFKPAGEVWMINDHIDAVAA